MNWTPDAVRALEVDLAASDAVETLTAAKAVVAERQTSDRMRFNPKAHQ
jgi:hypothetical protein